MVQCGRFIAPSPSTEYSGIPNHTNLSGLSEDLLAACRLIPVYHADGTLALLSSERTRPGDIIIHSAWFGLVVRPHGDGDKFVVVGRVFFPAGIVLARAAPFVDECDRHRQNHAHHSRERITIAFELTDVEALEVVVCGDNASNVDRDGPESLERCTLGGIKAGAHVWDVTAEEVRCDRWGRGHSVGMGQLPCVAHRAGDYYWKYQKFLWYSVLMGTGTSLSFPQEDKL